ncbi:MAG: hypothetical protein LUH58_09360 [Lachnospiraceae bacterium]|nr:hypothetical protein [Lachnospiraceae bacterium]
MSKRKRTEFMKQKKTGARICRKVAALLLAMGLLWRSMLNASAADAASLDLSRAGNSSITVTLRNETGETAGEGTLILYQVASLALEDGNMVYHCMETFEDCGIAMEDMTGNASMLAETAQSLSAYVESREMDGVQAEAVLGEFIFTDLDLGLYLVVQEQAGDGFQMVAPFLVTVPLADEENGVWIYDVDASPKTETLSTMIEKEPPREDEPGEPEEEPPWEDKPGESEEEPPREDTPEAPQEEPPDRTENPPIIPQTGQLNWPVPVLALGGLLLILVGGILALSDEKKRKACR